MVKVSRSLKEAAGKAYAIREELLMKTGQEPSMEEIAKELSVSKEELIMAMESSAQVESLQKPFIKVTAAILLWRINCLMKRMNRKRF